MTKISPIFIVLPQCLGDSLPRWVYCLLPQIFWSLLFAFQICRNLESSPLPSQCAFHYSTWNSCKKMQAWEWVPCFKSHFSFTGQFTIKAGQSNSKGLKSTERVIIVQSEHIFRYTAKLHHNVVSWEDKKQRLREKEVSVKSPPPSNQVQKNSKHLEVPK